MRYLAYENWTDRGRSAANRIAVHRGDCHALGSALDRLAHNDGKGENDRWYDLGVCESLHAALAEARVLPLARSLAATAFEPCGFCARAEHDAAPAG